MLDPYYLQTLGDEIMPIINDMVYEILDEVAANITQYGYLSDSDAWLLQRVEALTASRSIIRKALSKYSDKTERQITQILKDAAYTSLESDMERYTEAYRAGFLKKKPVMILNTLQGQQIFESALAKVHGEVRNLTATMLDNANDIINILDRAHNRVVAGTISTANASANATREFAKLMHVGAFPEGASSDTLVELAGTIGRVTYPDSGHRDQIDVAIWRAVRTGASQTAGQLSYQNFLDMGGNLVKTTAHLGARIEHEDWQGETFWVNTPDSRFRSFKVTGIGTGPGLKGWNCRHDYYPVFDGLDDLSKEDPPVSENGLDNATMYAAEQKARNYERQIRELKRAKHALHSGGETDEEKLITARIKATENRYKAHVRNYGLQLRPERLGGYNYGETRLTNNANSGTIKTATLSTALAINPSEWIPASTEITNVHTIAGKGSNTTLRQAQALADEFGGSAKDWKKNVGLVTSDKYQIDVHWYEHPDTGMIKPKIKSKKER